MNSPASSAESAPYVASVENVAPAPLIVHVIHRFQAGGLENGLVNLINNLPPDRFRHAVVCLTESTPFAQRIRRKDVAVHELHKRPGKDPAAYLRLWRLLRALRPTIVHTRNLATIDCQFVAALAAVPVRIHGEHGWDAADLKGQRHRRLRQLAARVVHRFVAMSRDIESWLVQSIGIPAELVQQLYSGVDVARFQPRSGPRPDVLPRHFASADAIVVGSVGRLDPVKDPVTLLRALRCALALDPGVAARLRVVLVGGGPLQEKIEAQAAELGVAAQCWIAGERADIPMLMQAFDVFTLCSLNEGISNTILEAMASGLPVVATRVGGNVELVLPGVTGALCDAGDAAGLAAALLAYARDRALLERHGRAARTMVEERFSLVGMIERYAGLYSTLLRSARVRPQS